MIIYIFIFCCLLCFVAIKRGCKQSQTFLFFFTALLIILAGFRGEGIGFDYYNYVYNIYKSNDLPFIEPGVTILAEILRPLNNPSVFFVLFALFSISIKSKAIYEYSYYPILSLLLYYSLFFFVTDMGQIRYGTSLGICLYGLLKLAEGEIRKFWILVATALFFHYSALIVIPAFFIRNYRFTNRSLLLFIVLSLFLMHVNPSSIFLRVYDSLPFDGVSYKIEYYMITDEEKGAFGFNMSLFLRLIIFVSFYFVLKKQEKSSFMHSMLNFYAYGCFLYIFLNFNQEFASRGSGYFKMLELIIVPCMLSLTKQLSLRRIIILAVIAYCFYSFYNFFSAPDVRAQYVPYRSVLL